MHSTTSSAAAGLTRAATTAFLKGCSARAGGSDGRNPAPWAAAAAGAALNRPSGAITAGGGINTGARTNIGAGAGARTNVGVGGNTTNVNVGNVNVGNSVNYSNNSQAWVSQRQNWGNNVRTGVGSRYNNVFTNSFYRGGIVPGGYNYFGGWAARGPYYAWSPFTWASFGTFLGGRLGDRAARLLRLRTGRQRLLREQCRLYEWASGGHSRAVLPASTELGRGGAAG